MLNNSFFLFENRAVYGIMCETTVQEGRPQMAVWRNIPSWITKATNKRSEYVILIAFPLQQWLRERESMLRYAHIA